MEIKYYDKLTDDFKLLDKMINDEDYERFGEEVLIYVPLNTLEEINDFFIAYENDEPIACGCLKPFKYAPNTVELKRVFVTKPNRRKGIACTIVEHCENKAREIGYETIVLVTGFDTIEPLSLYKKLGYEITDNYGAYVDDSSCLCMIKPLNI